ncbi:MAG: SpoVA/SpoVAEb family sporulation membrane protein [Oscillospiraceae bacterium]|nr:SpoVA/SpoVAEb family sporulation membrane protein [Oscillospiraceae bacterium]
MSISQQQYGEMVKKASPNSKSTSSIPKAFLIGGLICAVGQAVMNIFTAAGFGTSASAGWTSVILVLVGALLTGAGLYDKMAKHGGAGTLVPITGFANAVASPALEFKSEGYVTGLGAKIFIIAGPVILYGVAASVVYGFVYYFFLS